MGETQSKEQVMARLDQQQYEALVKAVGYRLAQPETALAASFQLGIQYVLEKLRVGFVVGGY